MAKRPDKLCKSEAVSLAYQAVSDDYRKCGITCRLTEDEAEKFILAFLQTVKNALCDGRTVELRGFGTFERKIRAAKTNAYNFKTGERAASKAHYVIAFKSGYELKNAMKGDSDVPVKS